VITELEGDDLILCQITSRQVRDKYAVPLEQSDFESGTLKQKSNVRPNRLFTADGRIVLDTRWMERCRLDRGSDSRLDPDR